MSHSRFLSGHKTRQITLTTFFLLATLIVHAQIPKTTLLLGGNLTGNITNRKNISTQLSIEVNPQIAYFTGRNFCMGLSFPLSYLDYNQEKSLRNAIAPIEPGSATARTQVPSFSISPFLRKYFGTTKWMPFVQLNGYYATQNETSSIFGVNRTIRNSFPPTGFAVGAGVNYLVNERLAMESVLDYGREYDDRIFNFRFRNRSPESQLRLRLGLVMFIR